MLYKQKCTVCFIISWHGNTELFNIKTDHTFMVVMNLDNIQRPSTNDDGFYSIITQIA